MINDDELKRRVQQRYETLLDRYGTNDEIQWTTKDGREMTLGEMAGSHLCNAIAYFKAEADRSARLIDLLETHVEDNPNDHGNDAFIDNINSHLDANLRIAVITHAMEEQLKQRDAELMHEQRVDLEEKKLTLVGRLGRVREKKLATRLEEDSV